MLIGKWIFQSTLQFHLLNWLNHVNVRSKIIVRKILQIAALCTNVEELNLRVVLVQVLMWIASAIIPGKLLESLNDHYAFVLL